MGKDAEFRFERIKKILNELTYEVQRGIHEKDTHEKIGYQQILNSNEVNDGLLVLRFETQPMTRRAFEEGQFYIFKDELNLIDARRAEDKAR